jgi:hypothetical protein
VGGSEPPGGSHVCATVLINDVGNALERDADGLGELLEADLGLDPDDPDTDGDGLWDGFEVLGIRVPADLQPLHPGQEQRYPEQALPSWGADPRHKDVFLETDYFAGSGMAAPGQPLTPGGARLMAEVAGKCSGGPGYLDNPTGRPGFRIHVDNGSAPRDAAGGLLHTIHGDWGGAGGVPVAYSGDGWSHHMSPIRHGVFRYGLGLAGTGGLATLNRPFFFFGSDAEGPDDPGPGKIAIHELGHAFGLRHFGTVETGSSFNYKPHYVSLMNYAYAYGSPNPRASDPATRNWDPDNLRFSEGERLYELDAQGNRTGRELALDPAAIDEGAAWPDTPSWNSSTSFDLSHGLTGKISYPWYYLLQQLVPGHAHARLWLDWDRDGEIRLAPGSWTRADVLIGESASFKHWHHGGGLKTGPQLAALGDSLYLFQVRQGSHRISYRIYGEDESCDPEDVGSVGQEGLPASHQPLCGAWSGEFEIPHEVSVDSDLSARRNPVNERVEIFYTDTSDRLCVLEGDGTFWAPPVCAQVGIVSAPEAVVRGDRIFVYGLEPANPWTGVGRVRVVEMPAAVPADPGQWTTSQVRERLFIGDQWVEWDLYSLVTPGMAVDPADGSLLGITTDGIRIMHAIRSPDGEPGVFERLSDAWLDRPAPTREAPATDEIRRTNRRPAVAVERLANGQARWHLWMHGVQPEEPDAPMPFFRMTSVIALDGPAPRPAFASASEATPAGDRRVLASEAADVSLAFYRGKLRAAVGYDVKLGSEDAQGSMFFPNADGIFRAALKDHNDVEHLGRHMGTTLGPLFFGMEAAHRARVLAANRMALPAGAWEYLEWVSADPDRRLFSGVSHVDPDGFTRGPGGDP